MKKEKLFIKNTGLKYEIYSHGLVLCCFPTLRQAMERAKGIISELGLPAEIVYMGHV